MVFRLVMSVWRVLKQNGLLKRKREHECTRRLPVAYKWLDDHWGLLAPDELKELARLASRPRNASAVLILPIASPSELPVVPTPIEPPPVSQPDDLGPGFEGNPFEIQYDDPFGVDDWWY
jgi:hypothetical protein